MMCANLPAPRAWTLRRLALSLVVLATLAVPRAHAAAKASVAEVESAFRGFVQAWEHKDLAAATAIFTPDAVVYDPVGPGIFATPEAIRGWTADSFKNLGDIHITDTDLVTHVSGSAAWMTMHYVFTTSVDGKPLIDDGHLTLVWVKQPDGAYKIAVFHASNPPPPPPADKK